jgi:hypothetical protein
VEPWGLEPQTSRVRSNIANVLGEFAERMPPWPSRVSSCRDRTSGPRREREDRRRRPR